MLLQQSATLQIDISVPEADMLRSFIDRDVGAASERMQPQVILSALPGRQYAARLTEFATVADPATRTFEATFEFAPPEDVRILPGMTAHVRVLLAAEQHEAGYRIPAHAASIRVAQKNGYREFARTTHMSRAAVLLDRRREV